MNKRDSRTKIKYLLYLSFFILICTFAAPSISQAMSPQEATDIGNNYYARKEYSKAIYWWRKAAVQGNVYAEAELGSVYITGKGVPKNYYKAVYWMKKAAYQGYPDAEYIIGVAYAKGIGGAPKDYPQAIYWMKKAAIQGVKPAVKALKVLNKLNSSVVSPGAPTGSVAGAFSGRFFAMVNGNVELWFFFPNGKYMHREDVAGMDLAREDHGTYRIGGGYLVLNSTEKITGYAASGNGGSMGSFVNNNKNTVRLKMQLLGPNGKNGMVLDGVTYKVASSAWQY